MRLNFLVVLACATACATATPELFEYPDDVPLYRRQAPGTPQYECHANCGGVIQAARTTDYCSSSNFTSALSACLDCALQYNIWQYYGEPVSAAAQACGLSATPVPANSTSSAGGQDSTSVGGSSTEPAGVTPTTSTEGAASTSQAASTTVSGASPAQTSGNAGSMLATQLGLMVVPVVVAAVVGV